MSAAPKLVYIVGQNKLPFIRMFEWRNGAKPESPFLGVTRIENADIVLFGGGADIDPKLYGQKAIAGTHISKMRDDEDIEAYGLANGKVKVGICRGAQFLNVMNGGSLWQDVDHHRTPHSIREIGTSKKIWASSTHHQQMIPGPTATRVAMAEDLSQTKRSDNKIFYRRHGVVDVSPEAIDWEVLWYKGTSSLCFQPHPEMEAMIQCRAYFFYKLAEVMAEHEKTMEKVA